MWQDAPTMNALSRPRNGLRIWQFLAHTHEKGQASQSLHRLHELKSLAYRLSSMEIPHGWIGVGLVRHDDMA